MATGVACAGDAHARDPGRTHGAEFWELEVSNLGIKFSSLDTQRCVSHIAWDSF